MATVKKDIEEVSEKINKVKKLVSPTFPFYSRFSC